MYRTLNKPEFSDCCTKMDREGYSESLAAASLRVRA